MDSRAVVAPPYVAGPLRLEPFRGLMLTPNRVGDPASARAFARPYRAVAERLARWESRGFVHRDATPAVYVHEYTAGGMTIRGLVGALDVSRRAAGDEPRVLDPHEGILPAQADELAGRMAEMQLNPAPILLAHRGPEVVRRMLEAVTASAPAHEFTDRAEQRNRIWPIRDGDDLTVLGDALSGARALIADGHHRYAAYLQLQQSRPGGPADRGLAMLVDQGDTPLFLGAIHRTLVGTDLDDLESAAARVGRFRASSSGGAVAALGPGTLAITDGKRWATLELDLPDDRAAVEVLHESLIPALAAAPARIGYHHSVEDTLTHVTPRRSLGVLMPAPDYDLVQRIVAAGRLLPEKATSFQPKPSLGVLMRSLLDE